MPRDSDHRESIDTIVSTMPAAVYADQSEATGSLVVIYGGDLGRRIPLGTGEIECGRSTQTDIPLSEDDAVSRRHARFAWMGEGYTVSDLGSTNGTFVNDRSVEMHALRDGDQVKIGRSIFKFICGGNVENSYHEEIYRLMTIDGLTQIHNKRAFDSTLEREVSRGVRYQRPLSLVLFDLDHFKRVNDELGHLAGDAVLRQVAALMNGNIRREDLFARVGGEEFALILPELTLEAAWTVADKLRALLQHTPCRYEDHVIQLSASFGVTALPLAQEHPPSPTDLYRAADERLYLAKNGGRNRVC